MARAEDAIAIQRPDLMIQIYLHCTLESDCSAGFHTLTLPNRRMLPVPGIHGSFHEKGRPGSGWRIRDGRIMNWRLTAAL